MGKIAVVIVDACYFSVAVVVMRLAQRVERRVIDHQGALVVPVGILLQIQDLIL